MQANLMVEREIGTCCKVQSLIRSDDVGFWYSLCGFFYRATLKMMMMMIIRSMNRREEKITGG